MRASTPEGATGSDRTRRHERGKVTCWTLSSTVGTSRSKSSTSTSPAATGRSTSAASASRAGTSHRPSPWSSSSGTVSSGRSPTSHSTGCRSMPGVDGRSRPVRRTEVHLATKKDSKKTKISSVRTKTKIGRQVGWGTGYILHSIRPAQGTRGGVGRLYPQGAVGDGRKSQGFGENDPYHCVRPLRSKRTQSPGRVGPED